MWYAARRRCIPAPGSPACSRRARCWWATSRSSPATRTTFACGRGGWSSSCRPSPGADSPGRDVGETHQPQPLRAALDRLLADAADVADVVLVVDDPGLERRRLLRQQRV